MLKITVKQTVGQTSWTDNYTIKDGTLRGTSEIITSIWGQLVDDRGEYPVCIGPHNTGGRIEIEVSA